MKNKVAAIVGSAMLGVQTATQSQEFKRKLQALEENAPQEKQVGYIGSMVLKKGMYLFAINKETLEVEQAVFRKNLQNNHLELHQQKDFSYVAAINKKNALRKYLKNLKPIENN